MTISIPELINNEVVRFAKLLPAFTECNECVQAMVIEMARIINDPEADEDEKMHAGDAMTEALFPGITADIVETFCRNRDGANRNTADGHELNEEEAVFADRLQHLMDERKLRQEDLANMTGVGQPAISNMLSRRGRPQRRTVVRLAEAMKISPEDLWPGFSK